MIDSWQQKQILKLYIYFVVKTTSSVELFEVTHRNFKMAEMTSLHMYLFTNFVYNCVFRKDEKKPHETFPISKKTTYWKWTHILKKNYVLKVNTHLKSRYYHWFKFRTVVHCSQINPTNLTRINSSFLFSWGQTQPDLTQLILDPEFLPWPNLTRDVTARKI